MSPSNKSQQWRGGPRIARRRILTAGSTVIVALIAGCAEDNAERPDPDDDRDDQDDQDDSALIVEETSFEVISTNGGTGEQNATIDAEGETIRIEGTITGQNGCYTARLGNTSVDEEEELLVQVETYDDSDDDELCTQALIDIEYAAVLTLSREAETVSVEHDGEEIVTE